MNFSHKWKDALAALICMGCALLGVCLLPYAPVLTTSGRPSISVRPVPVIDAGHGGEDGGAVSLSGRAESQINLQIARKLDYIFGLMGEDAVMLRTEDISLYDPNAVTLRQKKVSDIHHRVEMVNAQNRAILISIHQNSYPDARYGGAQVFFAPTDGSQALADTLQDVLRTAIDPHNGREAKRIAENIYLMNHVRCPAVLVECGFLTNSADEARLLDPMYQTKIATALAGGYFRYLELFAQEDTGFEGKNAVLLHKLRE